jgi:hypothetical protein
MIVFLLVAIMLTRLFHAEVRSCLARKGKDEKSKERTKKKGRRSRPQASVEINHTRNV